MRHFSAQVRSHSTCPSYYYNMSNRFISGITVVYGQGNINGTIGREDINWGWSSGMSCRYLISKHID